MTDQSKDEPKLDAKSEEPARSAAPAPPRKLDETVEGGRYLNANGQLVNANGEPIKEKSK